MQEETSEEETGSVNKKGFNGSKMDRSKRTGRRNEKEAKVENCNNIIIIHRILVLKMFNFSWAAGENGAHLNKARFS